MDDWYILVLWRLEIWNKFVWYDSCRVVNDSYSENRYRALRLCPIDFSLIPKVLVPPPEPKNMQSLQIWGICFAWMHYVYLLTMRIIFSPATFQKASVVMLGPTDTAQYAGSTSGSKDSRSMSSG